MLRDEQMDARGCEVALLESYLPRLVEGSPRDKLSLARNRWTLHDVSGHNKKSSPSPRAEQLQRSGGRADQVTIREFLLTRWACL